VAAIAEDEKQDVSANKRQIAVVDSLIKILQQKSRANLQPAIVHR
jgi:hypothetical protein